MDRVVQVDGVQDGAKRIKVVAVEELLILALVEGDDGEKVCFIIIPVPGGGHKFLQHRQVRKVIRITNLSRITRHHSHVMGTIESHLLVIRSHRPRSQLKGSVFF